MPRCQWKIRLRMTEIANNAVSDAWEYTPESYLQAKTLVHKRMKKVHPSPPFSGRWPTTYAMMMAQFDAAVNSEAVTAKEKLLELVNWFDGPAKRIIVSQTTRSDKVVAYAAALLQMDKLFKININSSQLIVADLVKGKQIDPESMD